MVASCPFRTGLDFHLPLFGILAFADAELSNVHLLGNGLAGMKLEQNPILLSAFHTTR